MCESEGESVYERARERKVNVLSIYVRERKGKIEKIRVKKRDIQNIFIYGFPLRPQKVFGFINIPTWVYIMIEMQNIYPCNMLEFRKRGKI